MILVGIHALPLLYPAREELVGNYQTFHRRPFLVRTSSVYQSRLRLIYPSFHLTLSISPALYIAHRTSLSNLLPLLTYRPICLVRFVYDSVTDFFQLNRMTGSLGLLRHL